ncbi:MAG: DMT family transporter [Calditrichaeota bacterium]|nr:DMT family transporter [Calditrichota bacterium]MCB9473860.1 DMT family transporter [Candidatus Delongbacteria bacterium]
MKQYSRHLVDLLALSVVLLWGFSFAAIKISLDWLHPFALTAVRFLPAALLLFALLGLGAWRRGRLVLPDRATCFRLFLLGLVGIPGYNLCLNSGQRLLPSSYAGLVIALNPAMIALFGSLWLKERLQGRTLAGLALSLAGLLVMVLGRDSNPALLRQHLLGTVIAMGAPLCWGIFSVGLRRYSAQHGSLTVLTIALGLGCLPLLLLWPPDLGLTLAQGGAPLWSSLAFLTIGCTVYGFSVWSSVLKSMPAARAGSFIYLVPLVAIFAGHSLLGEPLDASLALGGGIVLGGVWLATSGRRRVEVPVPEALA